MIKNFYKTDDYDKLFQYFFELYLQAINVSLGSKEFKAAKDNYPDLEVDKDKSVINYINEGLSVMNLDYVSNLFQLLMDRVYADYTHKDTVTIEQIHMINLSSYLIKGLRMLDMNFLLDTSNIWSVKTKFYAADHFYIKLPQSIRDQYDITEYQHDGPI